MRAEVVHQVQVTSLLQASPGLSESLLGDLLQLFSAQAQVVALVGTQHQLVDVLVIRRVPLCLRTVDEPLNLTGGKRLWDQEQIKVTHIHTVYSNIEQK